MQSAANNHFIMIPSWFYKFLIAMCVISLCIIGYKIADGEQDRSFIWFGFLFLTAVWYALRQLRTKD
jgi:purine-cytosine permease-like protein